MRQLVDATGSVGLAQTFDPYGNGYAKAGSAASSLGFTGEQVDSNGFVFLRARYYQPGMGRFTQMDPSRQERNAYQYSFGNPIISVDPTGWVAIPKVYDDSAGTLYEGRVPKEYWQDWYGFKRGNAQHMSARDRRLKAAELAQKYATYKAGRWPWGETPVTTVAIGDEGQCFDCVRFTSYILWRAGFMMYGPEFAHGEPMYFNKYGKPRFPLGQPTGWTASAVIEGYEGSSQAFWNTDAFVNEWRKPRNGEGIPRARMLGTCTNDTDCISLLQKLDVGDLVVYDYNDKGITWGHIAMVVQKNSASVGVASRGFFGDGCLERYKNPDGTDGKCKIPGKDCGPGSPLAGYLDVTGGQTFATGQLLAVGALHIDYEQYSQPTPIKVRPYGDR